MSNLPTLHGVPHSTALTLQKKWEARDAIIKRGKEAAKKMTTTVVRSVASGLTGGALGFVEGRYDRTEVAGMPLDAAAAFGMHAAAFAMPELEAPLQAAGDAAFAVYAYKEGVELGRDQKQKAGGY